MLGLGVEPSWWPADLVAIVVGCLHGQEDAEQATDDDGQQVGGPPRGLDAEPGLGDLEGGGAEGDAQEVCASTLRGVSHLTAQVISVRVGSKPDVCLG